MARYHDTGTICKAEKRACPLGLSDGDHIEAGSQGEFEEKLAARLGGSQGPALSSESNSNPNKVFFREDWDRYDFNNEEDLEMRRQEIEGIVSNLRYFKPNHRGYLLVAKASSPKYGSIGLPGRGKGYRIAGNLADTIQGLDGLESIEEDPNGEIVIRTSNHDFDQEIRVQKVPEKEYEVYRGGNWGTLKELSSKGKFMRFKKS